MPRALPLPDDFREEYILEMYGALDGQDPLPFLSRHVFGRYPNHLMNVPQDKRTPADFYRGVVRYCEMSAWAEEPPLIISLLEAFKDFSPQAELIKRIRDEGPYRCHPPGSPFYVARVSAEGPMLDRKRARIAALGFDPMPPPPPLPPVSPKRVLLVKGADKLPGLPSTLAFFRYLSAVQPEKNGVLYLDFGRQELMTQAASDNVPIELLIAQDLEQQARHIREDLNRRQGGEFFDDTPESPFVFDSLTDLQQRARWTRELACNLVEQALYRIDGRPGWWVAVFDNCKSAPAEAQEFVRRLVELTAGTGPEDVEKALRRQVRVVLIGDSGAMLPSPIYLSHLMEEDLSPVSIGLNELGTYFKHLAASLGMALAPEQIAALSQRSLELCQQYATAQSPPSPWTECLVRAVLEQTQQLELQAMKKGAK